jgi:hypothetical protein
MNYGDLVQRLEDFRDRLIKHRKLWGNSLEDFIPDQPVRNGAALEKQQRELSKHLTILDPYLALLSPGRTKMHRMSSNYWGHLPFRHW